MERRSDCVSVHETLAVCAPRLFIDTRRAVAALFHGSGTCADRRGWDDPSAQKACHACRELFARSLALAHSDAVRLTGLDVGSDAWLHSVTQIVTRRAESLFDRDFRRVISDHRAAFVRSTSRERRRLNHGNGRLCRSDELCSDCETDVVAALQIALRYERSLVVRNKATDNAYRGVERFRDAGRERTDAEEKKEKGRLPARPEALRDRAWVQRTASDDRDVDLLVEIVRFCASRDPIDGLGLPLQRFARRLHFTSEEAAERVERLRAACEVEKPGWWAAAIDAHVGARPVFGDTEITYVGSATRESDDPDLLDAAAAGAELRRRVARGEDPAAALIAAVEARFGLHVASTLDPETALELAGRFLWS